VRITIKAMGQVAEVLGEREFELELKRGNAMSSVRDASAGSTPNSPPLAVLGRSGERRVHRRRLPAQGRG